MRTDLNSLERHGSDEAIMKVRVLKPINPYFTEDMVFKTNRLRRTSQRYDNHVAGKIAKWI